MKMQLHVHIFIHLHHVLEGGCPGMLMPVRENRIPPWSSPSRTPEHRADSDSTGDTLTRHRHRKHAKKNLAGSGHRMLEVLLAFGFVVNMALEH